jgi:hypothetical protein
MTVLGVLVLIWVVLLFIMYRNSLVYKIRSAAILYIGAMNDSELRNLSNVSSEDFDLALSTLQTTHLNRWKKFESTSYDCMMFNLLKWKYDSFYPANYFDIERI